MCTPTAYNSQCLSPLCLGGVAVDFAHSELFSWSACLGGSVLIASFLCFGGVLGVFPFLLGEIPKSFG